MRILVDADSCPVKKIVEEVSRESNLDVIMFIDTSHELESEYSKIIFVDKGIDSVDLAILRNLEKGDVVVTGDFGLASLVLLKGGKCISQNGLIYTENNIERLLFERFIGKENRKNKIKTKNMRKRNDEDDKKFEESFKKIIGN